MMENHDIGSDVTDRNEACRRRFLHLGSGVAVAGVLSALSACGNEESPLANSPTPTPSGTPTGVPTATPTITPLTDTDMLVLMLQLTYLQAEFYSRAVLGVPVAAALTGNSTAAVTGPRQVSFPTAVLGEFFREIAFEKIEQLTRLRAVLGTAAVVQPALNLGVTDTGAFTQIARAATVVPATGVFDVYANEDQFLLGAFVLEDMVVQAYRGVLPLFTSTDTITTCGGLMATSSYHTAMVRTQIYLRGRTTGSTLRLNALRLSDARDAYSPGDDDQGVTGGTTTPNTTANITNADGEGIVTARPPQFTVNVVYMTRVPTTSGGFFPDGLLGTIRTSALT